MASRREFDIYQEVTDKIVAALEGGAKAEDWRAPWHKISGASDHFTAGGALPVNLDGRAYRGVNVPLLWVAAMSKGYDSNIWGTYKAFEAKGGQVRKGEKSTMVVFWSPYLPKPKAGERPEDVKPILFARAYNVFNVAQVDNYTAKPAAPLPEGPARIAAAEAFFAAQGVETRHGGNRAYYVPAFDYIQMPHLAQFEEVGQYYATLGHENVHATGHKSRCNRDMSGRFKSNSYAAEELIAELGAAFLCAILGIDNEPRPDHAQYLAGWLECLKTDKKAIFTAASAAQKAVDYMTAKGANAPAADDEDDAEAPALAA